MTWILKFHKVLPCEYWLFQLLTLRYFYYLLYYFLYYTCFANSNMLQLLTMAFRFFPDKSSMRMNSLDWCCTFHYFKLQDLKSLSSCSISGRYSKVPEPSISKDSSIKTMLPSSSICAYSFSIVSAWRDWVVWALRTSLNELILVFPYFCYARSTFSRIDYRYC